MTVTDTPQLAYSVPAAVARLSKHYEDVPPEDQGEAGAAEAAPSDKTPEASVSHASTGGSDSPPSQPHQASLPATPSNITPQQQAPFNAGTQQQQQLVHNNEAADAIRQALAKLQSQTVAAPMDVDPDHSMLCTQPSILLRQALDAAQELRLKLPSIGHVSDIIPLWALQGTPVLKASEVGAVSWLRPDHVSEAIH